MRDIHWLNLAAFGVVIGGILFAFWVTLIIVSASNGVNVADGLDGLATGAAIFAISSYIFIGFWQFNQNCNNPDIDLGALYKCYEVRDPLDLAIVAAAIAGALIGFLWWNTSPAQIFMGDTGSLGLGGALAALAILSRTELLLVLIGGLFLIVTGSVIVQRTWFKITKRRYGQGRRLFLMTPMHHHFEGEGLGRDNSRRAVLVDFCALRRGRRRAVLPRMGQPIAVRDSNELASWYADWRDLRVAVLGLGVTGFAAADTLAELHASVLVVAAGATDERADLLSVIGVDLALQIDPLVVPDELVQFDPELVIVSPGYRPDHPRSSGPRAAASRFGAMSN